MPKTLRGKDRASLEELLEFANKVREAGGGNPLDALMPAVPEDTSQCLIAKNLNFNCDVTGASGEGLQFKSGGTPKGDDWIMRVDDPDVLRKIAESLNLKLLYTSRRWFDGFDDDNKPQAVLLPARIGRVAEDFDDIMDNITDEDYFDNGEVKTATLYGGRREARILREFWPYIEESEKEALANATIVTQNGSIVIR